MKKKQVKTQREPFWARFLEQEQLQQTVGCGMKKFETLKGSGDHDDA